MNIDTLNKRLDDALDRLNFAKLQPTTDGYARAVLYLAVIFVSEVRGLPVEEVAKKERETLRFVAFRLMAADPDENAPDAFPVPAHDGSGTFVHRIEWGLLGAKLRAERIG